MVYYDKEVTIFGLRRINFFDVSAACLFAIAGQAVNVSSCFSVEQKSVPLILSAFAALYFYRKIMGD